MAKGQQKSNREIKKPKQVKKPASAEANGLTARLTASQEKTKGKK